MRLIIDVHAHLGWDYVFESDFTRDELLAAQDHNDIDITIVQPASCHDLATVQEQHDAVAQLAAEYPGRFYGMANPNPHLPPAQYAAELKRCIQDLGFIGVKIHTFAHSTSPSSQAGRRVFALAHQLGVPVMIHTGIGIPVAGPANILPVAREYPDVKIVMAHSGFFILAAEALQVAKACDNVYLEASWTGGFIVRDFVRELGAERVLFGSDHGDNAATEVTKFTTCGLSDEEVEWCLYRTAASIYDFPGRDDV